MDLKKLQATTDWIEEKIKKLTHGGREHLGYWTRFIANSSGALVTHGAVVLNGVLGERSWSTLTAKAIEWPVQGLLGILLVIVFWGLILATAPGGKFLRCFLRGLMFPVYIYFFLSIWI